jgi:hypothetical protein
MTSALRRLAFQRHPGLASLAFFRYRGFVQTGLLSEEQARLSIVASLASSISEMEAIEVIARGFAAAKGSRP